VGSLKEEITVVVVSYSGKEINAKLVYYGAGLSGKTTNLESIYEAVPDTSRGKMVSMKTQSDRTLFFDLLPLDLGEIMGFKTRFLLYTVPGQVFYNATRKLVLKGADAIVFVADSEVGKMEENKESLANLMANLAEYGLSIETIPWVIQYNKRDLPNVYSVDELNAELNPGGKVPFFEAVATQGKGVFETFRGISHLLMEKVTRDLRRGPTSSASRNATAPAQGLTMPLAPGSPAKPAEPAPAAKAQEPVRPFGPARLDTAAPNAPGRTIDEESRTAAPAASESVDYGREIELPSKMPAAEAPKPAPAEAKPASPAARPVPVAAKAEPAQAPKPQPVPVMAKAAPAPVAPKPEFAPVQPVASAAAATSAQPTAPGPIGAPAQKESQAEPQEAASPASGPSMPLRDSSVQTAEPGVPAVNRTAPALPEDGPSIGQAARGGQLPAKSQGGSEPIVVPVRIPKGASREIVLRIVIIAEDDTRS
jgi:signal recognition particle receptor subunit beta